MPHPVRCEWAGYRGAESLALAGIALKPPYQVDSAMAEYLWYAWLLREAYPYVSDHLSKSYSSGLLELQGYAPEAGTRVVTVSSSTITSATGAISNSTPYTVLVPTNSSSRILPSVREGVLYGSNLVEIAEVPEDFEITVLINLQSVFLMTLRNCNYFHHMEVARRDRLEWPHSAAVTQTLVLRQKQMWYVNLFRLKAAFEAAQR